MIRPRSVLLLLCGVLAAVAVACGDDNDCGDCEDIVANIPFAAGDSYTYRLEDNGATIGTTTLSVEDDGDALVLTQASSDEDGNSDEAVVTVDAETLKPRRSVRTIIDESERRVAIGNYESDDECDSGMVVRIEQLVFDLADDDEPKPEAGAATPEPNSRRENPLCVPEHSYDNDSSLFLWRTITFEEDYRATYNSVLANQRDIQQVGVTVFARVDETPAGPGDAWVLYLAAGGRTQRAWFTTTDDHTLLAYQNESFTFVLEE